ncbi:MAG: peptidoglycan-binding protein [Actinomycetota bacterium]
MLFTNPSRTLLRRLIGLCAVVWIIAAVIWFDPAALLPAAGDETTPAAPRTQSQIRLADISTEQAATGEIRYAEQRVVASNRPGTLTAVAPVGEPVAAGTVLYTVDEEPVIALIGDVPAWRVMGIGDVGTDVAQLESNLVAMGYDPDGLLTVDTTFTTYTESLVEAWQAELGREATGRIEMGDVVFVPADATVTSSAAGVGDSSPTEVLTVSGPTRVADIDVAVAQLESVAVGDEVSLRLPDGATQPATVERIRSVGGGVWLAEAAIGGTSDAIELPGGESIPVDVSWVYELARDTPVVRASALTRLDSGDYVVEVVDGAGATTLVPVGIDVRAGSDVAIVTDLEPGTVIITP